MSSFLKSRQMRESTSRSRSESRLKRGRFCRANRCNCFNRSNARGVSSRLYTAGIVSIKLSIAILEQCASGKASPMNRPSGPSGKQQPTLMLFSK